MENKIFHVEVKGKIFRVEVSSSGDITLIEGADTIFELGKYPNARIQLILDAIEYAQNEKLKELQRGKNGK